MNYLQPIVILCVGIFIGWFVLDYKVAHSPTPEATHLLEEASEVIVIDEEVSDTRESPVAPAEVLVEDETLITLDLSGRSLQSVSQSVFSKTNTQKLDLSNNNLTGALPAEVRHLQRLRVLDLSDNDFTGVPAEIGQLSKLRVLDLSNNQLTGLPHELGNLNNLQTLDLRGNDISTFDLDIIRERLGAGVDIKL